MPSDIFGTDVFITVRCEQVDIAHSHLALHDVDHLESHVEIVLDVLVAHKRVDQDESVNGSVLDHVEAVT